MTREEAVARIKDHIEIHRYHERNAVKIIKALDMAIKALEQPEQQRTPCDWCVYNPPSSMDGKPCTLCPAVANPEPFQKEGGE